jgi:hypothetical protein
VSIRVSRQPCTRGVTLKTAFDAHPARFKGRVPQPPTLPVAGWINPPKKERARSPAKPQCSLIA